MATAQINDCNFYYELYGSGKPLVLISGYAGDTTSWLPVIEPLSKLFQVLVFDNRGTYRTTDDSKTPITVELMAQDTIALINHLNLEKPHIVGLSMGGSIAQTIAANYLDKIDKLVLLCTSAKWRKPALLGLEFFLKLSRMAVNSTTVDEGVFPWIFGNQFLLNSQMYAAALQAMNNNPYRISLENSERQFAALTSFDGLALLNKIHNPTLIINGREDILSLPFEADFLAQQITNSRRVTLNCGHLPQIELPGEFIQALTNFLQPNS